MPRGDTMGTWLEGSHGCFDVKFRRELWWHWHAVEDEFGCGFEMGHAGRACCIHVWALGGSESYLERAVCHLCGSLKQLQRLGSSRACFDIFGALLLCSGPLAWDICVCMFGVREELAFYSLLVWMLQVVFLKLKKR